MRKTRSDCRVGTFEKKNGLPPGTVKKPKTPSPMVLVIIERIKYNIFYENLTGRDLHGKLSESGKFFISWKSSF